MSVSKQLLGFGLCSLSLLLSLHVQAAPTTPSLATDVAATAETSADADRRELKIDVTMAEDASAPVRIRASVDVDATPAEIWDAALNFEARVRDNWLIDQASVYDTQARSGGYHCRVRWDLSVMGVSIVYHTLYDLNRSHETLSWKLDGQRANDLEHAQGKYELNVLSTSPARTRLTYTTEVLTHHRAPLWVRRRIAVRGAKALLAGIRDRAEALAHRTPAG